MDRLTTKNTVLSELIFITACLLLVIPFGCAASTVRFEPQESQAAIGQTVELDITVDTGSDCINAAEINIEFPPDAIILSNFSRGGSILTFWTEFPDDTAIKNANQTGKLTFSGGIPGGYCGNVIKDSGSNNILGKLIFEVPGLTVSDKKTPQAEIRILDTSRVYLNDGMGTSQQLSASSSIVSIDNGITRTASDWETSAHADQTAPEPFAVEIQRDPSFFGGKYFAIFFTTDKQTGIDYYELMEQSADGGGNWVKTDSPYVLKDQTLSSTIKVRAFDMAGNTTEATYTPAPKENKNPGKKTATKLFLISIAAIIAIALASIAYFKKKRKKTKNKHTNSR